MQEFRQPNPKLWEKGNPEIPFFSNIISVRKELTVMPMKETKHVTLRDETP